MNTTLLRYLAALLLFGSNGIIASYILLNSYEIVFLRTLIGSVFLLLLFFCSRKKLTFYRKKTDFIYLSISGISMGTSWIFLYEAYTRIGVSIASLCYYCGPVIVMILSPILFHEKLTSGKITGFLAVLSGIFLVNGYAGTTENHWGLFCGIASAFLYACMVIFNKKAAGITGLENTILQLFTAFLTVSVFTCSKQGFSLHIPADSILPILILGIVNTGIGCYLYFSAIDRISVQTVAICGYLEPLSAVLFSVLILHETFLPLQVLGAVLIIGGAVLGELSGKRHRPQ